MQVFRGKGFVLGRIDIDIGEQYDMKSEWE